MNFFSCIAVGILTAALCIILRRESPAWSMGAAIAGGLVIAGISLPVIAETVQTIAGIGEAAQTEKLDVVFKIAGTAILGEWAVQLCRDAGEGAVAVKLETAIKIILISMSLPVLSELLQVIAGLLKGAGNA